MENRTDEPEPLVREERRMIMDRQRGASLPGVAGGLRSRVTLGVIAVGVVAALGIQLGQVLPGADATLIEMGFDADRARLISALTAGSLVAAAGSLLFGGRRAPILVGMAVFGIFDVATFWSETASALGVTGAAGRFDPIGWLLTLSTLVLSALAFCWTACVIALAVREPLRPAVGALRGVASGRAPTPPQVRRLVGIVAAIVVAAVVGSTFGDLVNFAPDVHMLAGAPAQNGSSASGPGSTVGLSSANPAPGTSGHSSATSRPSGGALPAPSGYRMVAGPLPNSVVTEGALSASTPWAAHPPSGTGQILSASLPAPWTGGTSTTATLDIYLPPDYGQPGVRYPVFYEAPLSLSHWTSAMQMPTVLDSLITSGAIPPAIFVFAASDGGPFVDSECADSSDGREWFDRYVSTTVVGYVESNYATIAGPAARTVFGFSEGGYCAPALLLRHPDVFGQAVALSGYYKAGLQTKSTPNAWMPFNYDQALISASSPLDLVPTLAPNVLGRLFVIATADPTVFPYDQQFGAFRSVVESHNMPAAFFPIANAHSWTVVRQMLTVVLPMIAQRQLALGVPIGG